HQAVEPLLHVGEPRRRGKRHLRRTMRLDQFARLDNSVTEIVEQRPLLLVGLYHGLNLIDRPAGDLSRFIGAALRHATLQRRQARRAAATTTIGTIPARGRTIVPTHIRAIIVRREDRLVHVAVAVSPERIVVLVLIRPQRAIEHGTVGVRPEQRSDPAQMTMMVAAPRIVQERPQRCAVGEIAVRGEIPGAPRPTQPIDGGMQSRRSAVSRCVVRCRCPASGGVWGHPMPSDSMRATRGKRVSVHRGASMRAARAAQRPADVADVRPWTDARDARAVPAWTDMRREAAAAEMWSGKILHAADMPRSADVWRRHAPCSTAAATEMRCTATADMRCSTAATTETRHATTADMRCSTAAAETRATADVRCSAAAAAAEMRCSATTTAATDVRCSTTATATTATAVPALGQRRIAGQESDKSGCT